MSDHRPHGLRFGCHPNSHIYESRRVSTACTVTSFLPYWPSCTEPFTHWCSHPTQTLVTKTLKLSESRADIVVMANNEESVEVVSRNWRANFSVLFTIRDLYLSNLLYVEKLTNKLKLGSAHKETWKGAWSLVFHLCKGRNADCFVPSTNFLCMR